METFLSTILFIIIGFYLLGRLLKILIPIWIRKKMKDFEQGKGGAFQAGGFSGSQSQANWGNSNRSQRQEPNKHEGDVTITKNKEDERNIDKEIGEYVDFDEVK